MSLKNTTRFLNDHEIPPRKKKNNNKQTNKQTWTKIPLVVTFFSLPLFFLASFVTHFIVFLSHGNLYVLWNLPLRLFLKYAYTYEWYKVNSKIRNDFLPKFCLFLDWSKCNKWGAHEEIYPCSFCCLVWGRIRIIYMGPYGSKTIKS